MNSTLEHDKSNEVIFNIVMTTLKFDTSGMEGRR